MDITPCNRHILIDLQKEEQKENSILLPEEYSPSKPRHQTVRVLATSSDCSVEVIKNDVVVVDTSMIEEVKIGDQILYFVLENYILANIKK